MKVIIPLAGKGTRLRPHTHTIAKPLVHVAGKPVLGYILDDLKKVKVDEIIFIIGHLGHQIVDYVNKNYYFKAKFIEQKELAGQAHAVKLAEEYVKGDDVLIWFVDTISDAKIETLSKSPGDGVIFVKEVEDARRFGVVETDKNNFVTDLVEKPDVPKSNLVNIGLYYVRNSKLMFKCIDELIDNNMQTKGEFYLMDAFKLMIKKGTKFSAKEVDVWEDCGKQDALLKTNKYYLENGRSKIIKTINSVMIPPVYIENGAKISDSIIGPHVSIDKNAVIKNSIIKNSIVSENATIENAKLVDSLVGVNAIVTGHSKKLNVGDDSEVYYS
jgi:glucose-1-phosphate thymidylyltransferase